MNLDKLDEMVNSIRWENAELRQRFQVAAEEIESLQNEIEQYKREILLRDETIQKLKQAFDLFEEQQRKPAVRPSMTQNKQVEPLKQELRMLLDENENLRVKLVETQREGEEKANELIQEINSLVQQINKSQNIEDLDPEKQDEETNSDLHRQYGRFNGRKRDMETSNILANLRRQANQ